MHRIVFPGELLKSSPTCYSSFRVIVPFFWLGSASFLLGIFLRLAGIAFRGSRRAAACACRAAPHSGIHRRRVRRESLSCLRQWRNRRGALELSRYRRSLHRSSKDARRLHPAADALPLHLLRLRMASGVRHRGSCGPAQRGVVLQHSLTASCHGVCLAFEGTRMRTWRGGDGGLCADAAPYVTTRTCGRLLCFLGAFHSLDVVGKLCANRATGAGFFPTFSASA